MLTWTECPILVVVGLRNKISPALTWRQLVCQCHWQQVGPAALSRGTHFLPTSRPLDDAAAAGWISNLSIKFIVAQLMAHLKFY